MRLFSGHPATTNGPLPIGVEFKISGAGSSGSRASEVTAAQSIFKNVRVNVWLSVAVILLNDSKAGCCVACRLSAMSAAVKGVPSLQVRLSGK